MLVTLGILPARLTCEKKDYCNTLQMAAGSLRYDSLGQRVILHPRPVHLGPFQPMIRAIGIVMRQTFDQRDAKTVARVRCEWRERGDSNGICIATDGKVRV